MEFLRKVRYGRLLSHENKSGRVGLAFKPASVSLLRGPHLVSSVRLQEIKALGDFKPSFAIV